MSQFTSLGLRQQVVEGRRSGLRYSELASEYSLNYNTVRTLCKRHSVEGEAGLVPRTANCGRRVSPLMERSFRLVRLVAHRHPSWGVPFILLRLREAFPDLPLQSVRHYQRRLPKRPASEGKASLPPEAPVDRARVAHEVWQVDAKERLRLSGTGACFLNFTDEKTTALLHAEVFSPGAHLPSPGVAGARTAP